jgi:hypothetical protein
MTEKKPTSSKVLMGLIVLMFTFKTISIICNWYPAWLGFIYYSNAPDQALDVLETGGTSHTVHVIYAIDDLLTPLRLGIADSIMVSTHPLLLVDITNSLWLEGLEMLDHMWQQLETSNCPSDLQYRIYRYVIPLGGK